MRIFISGGCKNGKSCYAQRLAKAQQTGLLFYVATMKPADPEDDGRIARHMRDREGLGFITVEQYADIENVLVRSGPDGSYLLDSLTALLANEMFPSGGPVNECAADKIIYGLKQILSNINNIVVVSDFIYGGSMIYDRYTELYRESLAKIDRAAAGQCDVVLEAAYANVMVHKGGEAFHASFGAMR